MPVLIEKPVSRGGNTSLQSKSSRTLEFTAFDCASDVEVDILVQTSLPLFYRGLILTDYDATPKEDGTTWDISAKYGVPDVQPGQDPTGNDPTNNGSDFGSQPGQPTYTFDTTGGTTHITQSISTRARYAKPGKIAPNHKGAIGVTKDSIEGTDIIIPDFAFSETHQLPDMVVTSAYKALLFRMTGTVNNAPFRGLATGEALFKGASGSKKDVNVWELTFNFAGSTNAANFDVGDIRVVTKRGWDYLWIEYEAVADEDAVQLVQTPKAVFVEKVYPEADFSLLGIGVD